MLEQGFGFTDVVKRPSNSASKLRATDYRRWGPALRKKLVRFRPLIVCFHGVTRYRNYLKYIGGTYRQVDLGLQAKRIDRSSVFVVPNPCPANAAYSVDDLVAWYQGLKGLRDRLKSDE